VAAEPRRIGVSVSESADLHRLGLVERHLRLALGEVARVVIRAGHSLVYGGHLDPAGYTAFLESEMDRYGRTDRPLQLVVGWSEHRRLSLTDLRRHKDHLGLRARITYLDSNGRPIAFNTDRGEDAAPVEDVPAALTALREYLVKETDARVLIGGKERGYQGEMPGIIQEAMLAIGAGQPLYLAGGFGGATATIAALVANLEHRWPPTEHAADVDGLPEVIERSGWTVTDNGLTEEENRRLATTHRPSEVASLVAIGLTRTFGA
jgi:SLOG cluster2